MTDMQGEPEGSSGTARTRPPRWLIPLAVIFILYLIARMIEFGFWLSGRL